MDRLEEYMSKAFKTQIHEVYLIKGVSLDANFPNTRMCTKVGFVGCVSYRRLVITPGRRNKHAREEA